MIQLYHSVALLIQLGRPGNQSSQTGSTAPSTGRNLPPARLSFTEGISRGQRSPVFPCRLTPPSPHSNQPANYPTEQPHTATAQPAPRQLPPHDLPLCVTTPSAHHPSPLPSLCGPRPGRAAPPPRQQPARPAVPHILPRLLAHTRKEPVTPRPRLRTLGLRHPNLLRPRRPREHPRPRPPAPPSWPASSPAQPPAPPRIHCSPAAFAAPQTPPPVPPSRRMPWRSRLELQPHQHKP